MSFTLEQRAKGAAALKKYWADKRAAKEAAAAAPAQVETPPAPPEVLPVYNPDRLAAQIGFEAAGTCFVQGKYLFSMKGKFLREAPQHLWYFPSEIEEENNRRAKARQRQMFSRVVNAVEAPLPQKLVDAQRENALASAAERLAE